MMDGLDDGPELPKSAVMAWKKPLVIKAFQEGLSARACGRVFDVSHETAACWTAGHQRKKDRPVKQPLKIEGLREAIDTVVKGYDREGIADWYVEAMDKVLDAARAYSELPEKIEGLVKPMVEITSLHAPDYHTNYDANIYSSGYNAAIEAVQEMIKEQVK